MGASLGLGLGSLILGGLGLMQQSQQAKAQRKAIDKATKPAEIQALVQKELLKQGMAYNPQEEDARAISMANKNAGAVLGQNLKGLNNQFALQGGSPTGDTAFNVSATNTANRVIDPLRQFQAQLAATETQRKMAALQPALGAPAGEMANTYFNAAQFLQPNYGPSLQMFSSALGKLFPGGGGGAAPGRAAVDPNSNIGMPGDLVGPNGMFYLGG